MIMTSSRSRVIIHVCNNTWLISGTSLCANENEEETIIKKLQCLVSCTKVYTIDKKYVDFIS